MTQFEGSEEPERPRRRYALYLRKSRTDLELEALGEEETLTRHRNMLMALAAKHEIHPDQITEYKELVSGESISERAEMQRLLSDVYQGIYDGVLVVEVERLARGNTKDQGEVADAFQATGTKIITPAKVYDPNNEFDQEYFEFGLFMSRREYKTINRRMGAGKEQAVMEGNYLLPQRIFGYDIVRKSKKDRYLVPRPDEAKIVQMIFDWYTEEHRSQGWIARQLTAMGIRTIKNKPEWNKGTVRDMLANVHYIGMVSWGRQRTTKVFDERVGKLVKKRIYGTPKIYKGKHKAIISVEQFEKAQAISARTKAAPPLKQSAKLNSPLAGLLRCCDCDCCMTLMTFASCPSVQYDVKARFGHPRREKCKKKSLPVSAVMETLVEALKAYIEDFSFQMEHGGNKAEQLRHKETVKAMESELVKQERRKRKLMDSWESEDGLYTRDEFIERKQMYTDAIEKIKQQLREVKANAPAAVDYEKQILNLHDMIDCIKNTASSAEAKNLFLKQFIEKITYDVIDFGKGKGGKPVLEVFLK